MGERDIPGREEVEALRVDQGFDRRARLVEEAPAGAAPVVRVRAGLAIQGLVQLQPEDPLRILAVPSPGDQRRSDAGRSEKRRGMTVRHAMHGAGMRRAPQLVKTGLERMVFGHGIRVP